MGGMIRIGGMGVVDEMGEVGGMIRLGDMGAVGEMGGMIRIGGMGVVGRIDVIIVKEMKETASRLPPSHSN